MNAVKNENEKISHIYRLIYQRTQGMWFDGNDVRKWKDVRPRIASFLLIRLIRCDKRAIALFFQKTQQKAYELGYLLEKKKINYLNAYSVRKEEILYNIDASIQKIAEVLWDIFMIPEPESEPEPEPESEPEPEPESEPEPEPEPEPESEPEPEPESESEPEPESESEPKIEYVVTKSGVTRVWVPEPIPCQKGFDDAASKAALSKLLSLDRAFDLDDYIEHVSHKKVSLAKLDRNLRVWASQSKIVLVTAGNDEDYFVDKSLGVKITKAVKHLLDSGLYGNEYFSESTFCDLSGLDAGILGLISKHDSSFLENKNNLWRVNSLRINKSAEKVDNGYWQKVSELYSENKEYSEIQVMPDIFKFIDAVTYSMGRAFKTFTYCPSDIELNPREFAEWFYSLALSSNGDLYYNIKKTVDGTDGRIFTMDAVVSEVIKLQPGIQQGVISDAVMEYVDKLVDCGVIMKDTTKSMTSYLHKSAYTVMYNICILIADNYGLSISRAELNEVGCDDRLIEHLCLKKNLVKVGSKFRGNINVIIRR